MTFIYTRADLKSRINGGIQGKIGMLVSDEELMNEVVRDVYSVLDLRSAKRRTTLTPDLYNGIFEYNCPSDLKATKIIDIPAQAKRHDGEFFMTTPEQFRTKIGIRENSSYDYNDNYNYNNYFPYPGAIAIDDYNGQRVLLINSSVDSKSVVVSEFDGLGSGASADWVIFGDAENLAKDDADFVKGAGSLKFDISSAGGTTAGISNDNVNSLDISQYLGGTSAFFVYARITDPTNITDYKLRFGSSSSVYHTKTVTSQADGTAFVSGWNLLRFEVSSLTDTGTPDDSAITYFALYMTKDGAKVSESDYKFDYLVLKKGEIHNIHYYTKYGWQSSASAYKENSTDDSDLLVADTDEFNLIIKEGRYRASMETDLSDSQITKLEKERDIAFANYKIENPSEAKLLMTDSYNFIDDTTVGY